MAASRFFSEEVSYWASIDETLLGMVFLDITDQDFMSIMLARDRAGRFRCVGVSRSFKSCEEAVHDLKNTMTATIQQGNIKELGDQFDEPNVPFDLLRVPPGNDPEKLHPYFRILLELPSRAPARAVLKEIGPWLAPSDPHFVSEFQLKNFDQRLWELYLWAAIRELGFDIDQHEAPDFICHASGMMFSVEATTVSKSQEGPLANHPNPVTPDEMQAFLADYMPMKFGSSLTSKLDKKNAKGESYLDRPSTANRPFILAVADFHKPGEGSDPGSMVYSQSALPTYLYGNRIGWEFVGGELVVRSTSNREHTYGTKVIPSGFFDLPGAENISAVMFSNAGTLSKFDSMGLAAGFNAPGTRYFRVGMRYNPDPNAVTGIPFREEVGCEGYEEYWSDELQLFHNPNAKIPIPEEAFGGITQHFFRDGQHHSITPDRAVLSSRTMIFTSTDEEALKRAGVAVPPI